MPHSWRKIILSLCAVPLAFASCKKNFSSDAPLTPVYAPSVIINSDNQVIFGIDPVSGLKNWEYNMPPQAAPPSGYQFATTPLLYNERLYIGSAFSDTLYKINAQSGALVKKMVLTKYDLNDRLQSTPVADGNLIYLATMNDTLYAIDTGTGAIKWSYGADAPLVSSPTIYNGHIYFASTNGTIYCLDKTIGDVGMPTTNWILPTFTGNNIVSSPAISAPYLYVGSVTDSNMYCIYLTSSTRTGVLRWAFKSNGPIRSSPTTIAGTVVFGTDGFSVYCVDTTTAYPRWQRTINSQVASSPYIDHANQMVYVGGYDYNLYALSLIDGEQKWKFSTGGLIKSSPIVYDNMVYIGSYDKNFYGIDKATGTQRWRYTINGQIQCSPVVDNLSGNTYNSSISGFVN